MELIGGIFLCLIGVFGAVGVARGYGRDLGVTIVLLFTLAITELFEERFPQQLNQFLAWSGIPVMSQTSAKTMIFCGLLILMVFIAYQSEFLAFGVRGKSTTYSLGAGLLNWYLCAGSLWYYLAMAGWPWLNLDTRSAGEFYRLTIKLLPPHVFRWEYLLVLAVFLLIMRVVK